MSGYDFRDNRKNHPLGARSPGAVGEFYDLQLSTTRCLVLAAVSQLEQGIV